MSAVPPAGGRGVNAHNADNPLAGSERSSPEAAAGAGPRPPEASSRAGEGDSSAGSSSSFSSTDAHASSSSSSSTRGFSVEDAYPPSLFFPYSPERNARHWRRRPLSVLARGARITWELSQALAIAAVAGLRGGRDAADRARARALRRAMVRLGAAAVKIGQAASSRPDLARPAFLAELEKLQDRIPPFPTPQALKVMAAELGVEPSEVFSELSREPVAAASLGQVYRGRLRSTGEEVAVKVQRPRLAAGIALDAYVLRCLAVAAARAGAAARAHWPDPVELVDAWAASLLEELDYRHEAANAARFRHLYGSLRDVHVPKVYPKLCTRRVLVMEWVEGRRLRTGGGPRAGDASGFAQDPQDGSDRDSGSASAWWDDRADDSHETFGGSFAHRRGLWGLKELRGWWDGLWRRGAGGDRAGGTASWDAGSRSTEETSRAATTRPTGIAAAADPTESGGTVPSPPPPPRAASAPLPLSPSPPLEDDLRLVAVGVRCSLEQVLGAGFYHADPHPGNLLRTSAGKLAYVDFGMMGEIGPGVRHALLRAVLHLVDADHEALARDMVALGVLGEGADKPEALRGLAATLGEALQGGAENLSFTRLSVSLAATMYRYRMRIPPYYTLLVRSLSVLEGIALATDPDYRVLVAAYPWIARRLLAASTPQLRELLLEVLYRGGGRLDVGRLTALLKNAVDETAGTGPDSDAGAHAGAGSADSDSVISLFLSKEGEFVRALLIDELADATSAAIALAWDALSGCGQRLSRPGDLERVDDLDRILRGVEREYGFDEAGAGTGAGADSGASSSRNGTPSGFGFSFDDPFPSSLPFAELFPPGVALETLDPATLLRALREHVAPRVLETLAQRVSGRPPSDEARLAVDVLGRVAVGLAAARAWMDQRAARFSPEALAEAEAFPSALTRALAVRMSARAGTAGLSAGRGAARAAAGAKASSRAAGGGGAEREASGPRQAAGEGTGRDLGDDEAAWERWGQTA